MSASQLNLSVHGVSIPPIIYGTAWKKDRTAALVQQAIDCGFRGIDTACQPKHYYEAGVGEGLAAAFNRGLSRSDIYVQSKFTPVDGQDPESIPYDAKANLAIQVAQSFDMSLQHLQTDYLDALILHSPLTNLQELLEVWQAMEKICCAGGSRLLGISNCYKLEQLQFLWQAARIKPAIVQNRFYAATGYDVAIRDFCQQKQMLYQSFWTLSANSEVLNHPSLKALSTHYQRSPAQIFFRFLTQLGIVPLTGTCSKIHMQEDLSVFEFTLQAQECASISALLA
ncbi:MAG: aldo/keto reductase [Methylococcales bacterium]